MVKTFLAVAVLLLAPLPAWGQDGGAPEARWFGVSSVNSVFAMQGYFEGEYTVHPGGVELKLRRADVRVGEHCPYKGRRALSSVRFGLATAAGDGRWRVAYWGQEFPTWQVLSPGDRHSLGELYFYIPVDDSADLSRHWLVVQMGDEVLDIPEERRREGYAFAHGPKGMFAPDR